MIFLMGMIVLKAMYSMYYTPYSLHIDSLFTLEVIKALEDSKRIKKLKEIKRLFKLKRLMKSVALNKS